MAVGGITAWAWLLMAAPTAAAADADDVQSSVRRVMRLGFPIEEMQALPVSPISFRLGLPVDEQASGDDHVYLTRWASVGTLIRLQRDFTSFREVAGRPVIEDLGIGGLRLYPLEEPALHLGLGLHLTLDRDPDRERPYLAVALFGVRF